MTDYKFNYPVAIIAAVAENRVIGRNNKVPWKLATDMDRFQWHTKNNIVIMGRKTFDSLGKPLPDRLNIVITRNSSLNYGSGVPVVNSLEKALKLASMRKTALHLPQPEKIYIIGGGQIYSEAMKYAETLHITYVMAEIEGDTLFPVIDEEEWEKNLNYPINYFPRSKVDEYQTRYRVYNKRP